VGALINYDEEICYFGLAADKNEKPGETLRMSIFVLA
jgi:hypothetical protein